MSVMLCKSNILIINWDLNLIRKTCHLQTEHYELSIEKWPMHITITKHFEVTLPLACDINTRKCYVPGVK